MSEKKNLALSIGCERLRMSTDGEGVTTLFGFWGCPLQCKHCLNPQSWKIKNNVKEVTPEELYHSVSIDRLYFIATNGGVTFGGGEPLLYPDFIKEFSTFVAGEWNINIETSLNVKQESIRKVTDVVNHYFIDIKDMNDDIYQRYTGKSNAQVLLNLKWIISEVGVEKITVKVSLIPDFNTADDVRASVKLLKEEYGVTNIMQVEYKIVNKI